jgi:hypothetical protein
MNTYPAISFTVRNRKWLRLAISSVSFAALMYLAFRWSSVEVAVAAVAVGLLLYFVLALVFEILILIYETLVPQL